MTKRGKNNQTPCNGTGSLHGSLFTSCSINDPGDSGSYTATCDIAVTNNSGSGIIFNKIRDAVILPVAYISSVDQDGFPWTKAMLKPRKREGIKST